MAWRAVASRLVMISWALTGSMLLPYFVAYRLPAAMVWNVLSSIDSMTEPGGIGRVAASAVGQVRLIADSPHQPAR